MSPLTDDWANELYTQRGMQTRYNALVRDTGRQPSVANLTKSPRWNYRHVRTYDAASLQGVFARPLSAPGRFIQGAVRRSNLTNPGRFLPDQCRPRTRLDRPISLRRLRLA